MEFSRNRAMDRLNFLGRRTLSIYFLHFSAGLIIVAILAPVAPSLERFGELIPP